MKTTISGGVGRGSSGDREFPTVYITQLHINAPSAEAIYAPREDMPGTQIVGHIPAAPATATMELEMTATPGAIEILHNIMRQQGDYSFGMRRDEWKCIWCGTIHPIMEKFCSSCGGSRGWIM